MKEYKKSEEYLSAALAKAREQNDSILMECCYGNLIIQYNEEDRFSESWQLYSALDSIGIHFPQSSTFLSSVACMYADQNKMEEAVYYLRRAGEVARNRADSVYLYYYGAKIFRKSGNDSLAYKRLGRSIMLQDSVLRQVLQQPILSTQRDFLINKLEYQTYRARIGRRERSLYGSVVLVFVLLLFGILLYRLRCKNAEVVRYMSMLGELHETLAREQSQADEYVACLFKEKFSLLNELGAAYYEHPNDLRRKERIYRDVRDLVNNLRNPKTQEELEDVVNRYKQDAMLLLRKEFPNLKERDYRQLCYHFVGFSVNLIGSLMDENAATIYKRRSRYRARFQASEAQHRALFLDLLTSKD